MSNWILIILGVVVVAGIAALVLIPEDWLGGDLSVAEEAAIEVSQSPVESPTDDTGTATAVDAPESPAADESIAPPPDEIAPTHVAPAPGFAIDGSIQPGEYAHDTVIAGVEVHWANDDSTLRVGLVSPGTGYVAIGFDPESQMEGANYIVGYMEEGEVHVRDDYGTSALGHMADTDRGGTNDVLAAAGAEWGDETILEFMIPLDSGDAMDKPLATGETYSVLVAYHALVDGFSTRHSGRGAGQIALDR